MKRKIAFLLMAATMLIPTINTYAQSSLAEQLYLTEDEQTFVAEQGPLVAIINPENEPYVYFENGTAVGIIPEIVAIIEQQTGFDIVIEESESYAEYAERIQTGDFDLVLDAVSNSGFQGTEGLVYSKNYLEISYNKISLKKGTSALKTVAVLPEYSAATLFAGEYYYQEQFEYYQSAEECLAAVRNGSCSETIMNNFAAEKLMNEDVRNKLVAATLGGSESICIAIKGDRPLMVRSLLNKAIGSIDDTTKYNIISRYTQYVQPALTLIDYIYLNPVNIIAGFGIIMLFFIMLGLLRIQQRRRALDEKYSKNLERFISYVCEANTSVVEVDMEKLEKIEYHVTEDGIDRVVRPYVPGELLNLIHEEDKTVVEREFSRENLNRLIESGAQRYFECRMLTPDQGYRWGSCIIQGIKPDSEHLDNFMIYIRDITESKTEEIQQKKLLMDAVARAENANQAKSGFLSRMSHEIRTPMNAIVGLTAIAKHHEEEPAKIDEYLTKIDSASKVLLNIINDVLDMSAIESSKLKIAHNSFNVRETLMSISNIYYPQCMQKGIDFEMRVSGIAHENLIGDGLRTNQILLNLISNAYKFTPANGKITIIAEETTVQDNTAFLRFVVEDTGCGMTEEMLKRLFKPFEQENATTAQRHGGSGLGMSIAKNLVDMMQGTISVESVKDEGTTFTVNLPYEIDPNFENMSEEDLEGLSVFAVDDDENSLEYTEEILKRIGVSFETASSGEEAVRILNRKKEEGKAFDVCFVDWKMPDMDGLEVTKKIRELYAKDTMVIIASAYDLSLVEEDARKAGADRFVEKPLFQSTVFNLLMSMSNGHSLKNETGKDKEYDFTGKNILLAEDTEFNRDVATELLDMVHASVECAVDGKEAWEKFINSEPGTYDVILMDIQMPIMNGYESARAIRGSSHPEAKTIPIYAMTANAFTEDVTAALDAGMDGHIAKPIDTNILYDILDKVFFQ